MFDGGPSNGSYTDWRVYNEVTKDSDKKSGGNSGCGCSGTAMMILIGGILALWGNPLILIALLCCAVLFVLLFRSAFLRVHKKDAGDFHPM